MIVTIDGPAGAGKSTIALRLAQRLGFHMLDTGAMYRALTWSARQAGIPLSDTSQLVRHGLNCPLRMKQGQLLLGSQPLGNEIRSREVTNDVHYVADNPQLRQFLVYLQRQFVDRDNYVSEGRDQGTVAFPDSPCKFFLTATAESRARRRQLQLAEQGRPAVFDEVLADQHQRDRRDESRPIGRLMKAMDAISIHTDGLSISQVVERLETIARTRLAKVPFGEATEPLRSS